MEDNNNYNSADLHRIPIGSVIYKQYVDMNEEFSHEIKTSTQFTKGSYSEMGSFETMARSQARGFPAILNAYDNEVKKLNSIYGDPYLKSWELGVTEARQRKELLENLAYDLGLTRSDERPEPAQRSVYDFVYNYDGRQIVYREFKKRLKENRNLVLLFTGKVGGGKSYGSLSVADYLTPAMTTGYNLESMVYSIDEFIEQVKTLPAGNVIIMDEAGITAGSRDTMTRESKVLNKVIQSIRYLQHCSIFNLPNINFLDKSIRLMIDIVFDHTADQRQGEFTPYIPVLTDDGKEVILDDYTIGDKIIKSVYFPLPRPSLIEDYEKKRRSHNLQQLNELQTSLRPKEDKKEGRKINPNSLKNLKQFKGGE
ncbi:hypothetical protein [Acidiplasma sp.]|uniref:hypothetical protein n=1 Tax=Acidiplasma sp. TaxID=1872114 RepID=UPI00258411CC|nr:hypothetical protein [Acidiplasma sp.]